MGTELNLVDPELARLVDAETRRQAECLSLIASENLASQAIMEIHGSVLTNKVVEGYPGRRFHSGCQHIDEMERLALERAKRLFGAEHANVQPHSGVSANLAVYAAVLKPGDRILAMDLAHGGHLSHGAPASITGSQLYQARFYSVDRETEQVDLDAVRRIAEDFKPKMIISGYSAYPRALHYGPFREIADRVGAYLLVDMAHIAGLVAAGLHPSPLPFADFVTATCYKTLRGTRGGFILCRSEYARRIDHAVFPGTQGSAVVAHLAAKALTFHVAGSESFRDYCRYVVANARALAIGLRDGGVRLVAGGTDTHQVLVDLRPYGISGAIAELALDRAGIQTNKNLIPYDTNGPEVTSGLRLGSSGVTSRGMGEAEMVQIAELIVRLLRDPGSEGVSSQVQSQVRALCQRFPSYLDRWSTSDSSEY